LCSLMDMGACHLHGANNGHETLLPGQGLSHPAPVKLISGLK
jgi:hypothetical protein